MFILEYKKFGLPFEYAIVKHLFTLTALTQNLTETTVKKTLF